MAYSPCCHKAPKIHPATWPLSTSANPTFAAAEVAASPVQIKRKACPHPLTPIHLKECCLFDFAFRKPLYRASASSGEGRRPASHKAPCASWRKVQKAGFTGKSSTPGYEEMMLQLAKIQQQNHKHELMFSISGEVGLPLALYLFLWGLTVPGFFLNNPLPPGRLQLTLPTSRKGIPSRSAAAWHLRRAPWRGLSKRPKRQAFVGFWGNGLSYQPLKHASLPCFPHLLSLCRCICFWMTTLFDSKPQPWLRINTCVNFFGDLSLVCSLPPLNQPPKLFTSPPRASRSPWVLAAQVGPTGPRPRRISSGSRAPDVRKWS